jgi:hypothetical protein
MNASARPPVLASWVLNAILAPRDREAVLGDLLEEYRLDRLPALGKLRADVWFVGQVARHVWRSSWFAVVPLASAMMMGDFHHALIDPYSPAFPQNVFGAVVLAGFLMVGIVNGRRTGRVTGATLLTTGTWAGAWFMLGLWWAATLYPFAPFMRESPYWISAWHYKPNDLSFERWLLYDNIGAFILGGGLGLAMSTAAGIAGGLVGRVLARRSRATGT